MFRQYGVPLGLMKNGKTFTQTRTFHLTQMRDDMT